jgi:hypothetical protein
MRMIHYHVSSTLEVPLRGNRVDRLPRYALGDRLWHRTGTGLPETEPRRAGEWVDVQLLIFAEHEHQGAAGGLRGASALWCVIPSSVPGRVRGNRYSILVNREPVSSARIA